MLTLSACAAQQTQLKGVTLALMTQRGPGHKRGPLQTRHQFKGHIVHRVRFTELEWVSVVVQRRTDLNDTFRNSAARLTSF